MLMKITAFILAIFIFALSVAPCSDGHTCDEESSTELSGGHDHSKDEKDHCTLFCACACCGSIFTMEELPFVEEKNIIKGFVYNFWYTSLYSFSFINAVWHPPCLN